jgi:hypothetical protein
MEKEMRGKEFELKKAEQEIERSRLEKQTEQTQNTLEH